MNHDDTIENLLDAIHGAGVRREASEFLVEGRSATGAIGLRDGLVVHARYGDADGPEALGRLLSDAPLLHQAVRGEPQRATNMRLGYQAFLLEALRRLEAPGRSEAAQLASDLRWDDVMPGQTGETSLSQPAAAQASPTPTTTLRTAPVQAPGGKGPLQGHAGALALLGAGVAVLVVVVALGIVGSRHGPASAAAPAVAAPAPDPAAGALEASALEAAGAELPVLAAGDSPPSPAPELGLRPTVVCRLLVDARGVVVQATVYQRRADLELFEEAALKAVRAFRFAPARKAGVPVAAWINWPVQFR